MSSNYCGRSGLLLSHSSATFPWLTPRIIRKVSELTRLMVLFKTLPSPGKVLFSVWCTVCSGLTGDGPVGFFSPSNPSISKADC